jgi:hypothetical protein
MTILQEIRSPAAFGTVLQTRTVTPEAEAPEPARLSAAQVAAMAKPTPEIASPGHSKALCLGCPLEN